MTQTANPTTDTGFVRMLGPMERFLWAADFDNPTHFAMSAHIEGQTSLEEWRRAIDSAQRRHPLCSVCIDVDADQTPFFRSMTEASIPLRIVEGDAATDWAAEMERELSAAFSSHQAPLMRAFLIHEEHQATLTLVAHHSLADGLAMIYVLRDVFSALAGTAMSPFPVGPSQEELLGLIAPSDGDLNPTERSDPATVEARGNGRKEGLLPRVDRLRLTPELTAKLRERARQEGTTLHGALSAALVLAGRQISEEWKRRPVRVLSPIDTRKMLNQAEDCVVRVSVGLVLLDPEASPDFWELARLAKRSLAEAQTRAGIQGGLNALHQALLGGPDLAVAAHLMENVFIHDILLTNLGNLPYEPVFGALKLEALWGPAVMGNGDRQTVGVVTVGGALHLLHTSYTPIPSLLPTAEQFLAAACGP